jgi:4-amino-4-deoxy-L-arabinose transferase-like glycosyltransferase
MTNEIAGFDLRKKWRLSNLQQSAKQVIQAWDSAARGAFPACLIIGIWLVVAVPPAIYHGYHYVEGLTVTLAQSALDDGNWLTPHLYNLRWIERPTLLSWIIAAISMPSGHVSPFVARLPTILSLLAGAFLIRKALRQVASPGAAMFGALAFLASPLVIRYYVTAVADMPLAVLLFATFLVWWNSYASGRISLGHWITLGCMLAIAALLKGPQPVGYFMLGVFTFAALTGTWRQLPGLVLTGILAAIPTGLWYAHVFARGDQSEWLRYTRLSAKELIEPHPLANAIDFVLEAVPAAMLAIPLILTGSSSEEKKAHRHFIVALTCYAFACTFVILFWPAEINPRYFLPVVPPLCVLAGLGYDALSERWPALVAAAISVTLGLLGYAAVHSVSDILVEPAYVRSKVDGAKIAELISNAPAPIYRTTWDVGLNELAYVRQRSTAIELSEVTAIPKPAWIVVPADDASALVMKGNGHLKSRLKLHRAVLLRSE